MYRALLFFIICLFTQNIFAQHSQFIVINEIVIHGNKKTNDNVILIELELKQGDTLYLTQLKEYKNNSIKRILSTGLFTNCDLQLKNYLVDNNIADVVIVVHENLFIFPSFVFELADRNFNTWWKEYNFDFSRINYGIGFDHINLTGNRDKLKIKFQRGYTHKYEIKYNYPYLNNRWGFHSNTLYSQNKEIPYNTVNNKLLFHRTEEGISLLKRFRVVGGIDYRPNVYLKQKLTLEYHYRSVDDLVLDSLNSQYLGDNISNINYFALNYNASYDKRVFNLYPEGGYIISIDIRKTGLGFFNSLNNLSISVGYEKTFKLNRKTFSSFRIKGKAQILRNKVPYFNNIGLGYNDDTIRGYEYYVIDGTDWIYAKMNFRFRIYKKDLSIKKLMPINQLKKMAFKLYFRLHGEVGYVNEPVESYSNILNNRLLKGYGFALDFIMWNMALISVEYNLNHLNEKGIYLNSEFSF